MDSNIIPLLTLGIQNIYTMEADVAEALVLKQKGKSGFELQFMKVICHWYRKTVPM
jgi:hypothetical protein